MRRRRKEDGDGARSAASAGPGGVEKAKQRPKAGGDDEANSLGGETLNNPM